jgi:hypothetical protein
MNVGSTSVIPRTCFAGRFLGWMLRWGDWKADGFRTAMDLEKSFGPAYARGSLVQGQQAWAVIAVNAAETPGDGRRDSDAGGAVAGALPRERGRAAGFIAGCG